MDHKKVLSEDTMNLIDQVQAMRDAQIKFFAGQRSIMAEAKKLEKQVDNTCNRLLSEAGYTPEEFKRRPGKVEQAALF